MLRIANKLKHTNLRHSIRQYVLRPQQYFEPIIRKYEYSEDPKDQYKLFQFLLRYRHYVIPFVNNTDLGVVKVKDTIYIPVFSSLDTYFDYPKREEYNWNTTHRATGIQLFGKLNQDPSKEFPLTDIIACGFIEKLSMERDCTDLKVAFDFRLVEDLYEASYVLNKTQLDMLKKISPDVIIERVIECIFSDNEAGYTENDFNFSLQYIQEHKCFVAAKLVRGEQV